MIIKGLTLTNFRNFPQTTVTPCEHINIFYGDNAQGKTNLLEAIWLFTGAKSFRGAKDNEFIEFDKEFCSLSLDFYAEGREQNAQIKLSKTKKVVSLNDIEKTSVTKLAGEFLSVAFSPTDLALIKESPTQRRKFIDGAIGQIKPRYISYLGEYVKVLTQRNAVLKDLKFNASLHDMLDLWDEQITQIGANILSLRNQYIRQLRLYSVPIYEGICEGKEHLDMHYHCSIEGYNEEMSLPEIKEIYAKQIRASRKEDILTGSTNVGAHRDDILFYLDHKLIKSFGSQGQQRSVVLALKLAQCQVISSQTKSEPIILLDDVMSELDNKRKDYLLNHIKDKQVFITCCDKSYFDNLKQGKSFLIHQGGLQEVNQIITPT